MSEENLKHFSERRMDVCKECPEYHAYLCKQCGCFMPVKVKFAAVQCPLGKWGPEPPNKN